MGDAHRRLAAGAEVFLASAFLAGLVTLVIPWWLHRLRVHSQDRRRFSSLFLMRPSEAPVHLEKRLKHLWLLALRLVTLVLIVLAFAQPVMEMPGDSSSSALTPSRSAVIVLDTSLSMRRQEVFGEAVDTARGLLDGLLPGARAALVEASDELRVVVPLTVDTGALTVALGRVEPSASRLAFEGLVAQIDGLTSSMSLAGESVTIHLISDFQASAVPARFNALLADAAWPIVLHRIGETEPNWSIEQLRISTDAAAADDEAELLNVDLRGFATPQAMREVILESGAGVVAQRRISVPADGATSVSFQIASTEEEWTVRLGEEDGLADDNVRYLAREVLAPASLPVLSRAARPARYFNAAVASSSPRFRAQRHAIDELSLDEAVPVVALIDPGALPVNTANLLERHLHEGGAVFMAVGPATRTLGRLPLVDTDITANRFDTVNRGLVAKDRTHPVLSGFSAWRGVAVFQRVEPTGLEGARVLLVADDGAPLLVEYRIGAGRLMVLLTALDPAWTSWVVQPAFVEFVDSLLGYLAEDVLPVAATVGEPIALPVLSVQLIGPDGERVLGLSDTVERPTVRLSGPGLYQLRTPGGLRALAVNVPAAESDLRPASAALLARWEDAANSGVRQVQELTSSPLAAVDFELAPWLLALLLLLAVLEPLTANLGTWLGVLNRAEP